MKLFLDTNALIDLVARREPYVSDVGKLCIAAYFGDVQLWASTQSYADAYYVLRRAASGVGSEEGPWRDAGVFPGVRNVRR